MSKLEQSGLERVLRSYPERGKVYMIHDVVATEEEAGEFAITIDNMERLADYLGNNHVIRLEDWDKEKDFVALSADDVAQGFYRYAFPLLKERGLPFTIFVNVGLLNTEGYITDSQLREMAAYEGCTVGSHGLRHVQYRLLSHEEYEREIRDSKKRLAEILGKAPEIFAFPYGSTYACGNCDIGVLGEEYKSAFTTLNSGVPEITADRQRYLLPRINVCGKNILEIITSKRK